MNQPAAHDDNVIPLGDDTSSARRRGGGRNRGARVEVTVQMQPLIGGLTPALSNPDSNYHILDRDTGRTLDACHGPLGNGACARVPIGAIVPCAGACLVRMHADGAEGRAYEVSGQMSLCPVLLASTMPGSDQDLLPS